jgi:5'-3' exonuclease
VKVHLVDGTYELFRHFYGVPSHTTAAGHEVAAVRGVLGSVLNLLEDGATHIGVATDQIIESFRNDMYPGYKTGAGVDPALYGQFRPLEVALEAMGVVVWAMREWEADDALASAAQMAAADPRVEQVVICTPDKDLAQCVRGTRVVQLDRRKRQLVDEAGVRAKFGVDPPSIPDFLALVGDSADGFPGLPGWGAKSAAAVLAHYRHLEAIPDAGGQWEVSVRNGPKLAATLAAHRDEALLYRDLATLRTEPLVIETVDELEWRGPVSGFAQMATHLDAAATARRAEDLAAARG